MSDAVLDASALLAFIWREPGRDVVASVIRTAVMSAVNYSEVAARLFDRGQAEATIRQELGALALEIVPFDEEQAWASAALRPVTRHLGLSLGDRACLALAKGLGLPAYTADRPWSQLDLGIAVRVIR